MPTTANNKYLSIDYRELRASNITDSFLKLFDRYQETTQVYALIDGQLVKKQDPFIETWDDEKLVQVSHYLRECARRGGIVLGAFNGSRTVGFAVIEPEKIGSRNQYVEMTYCHVTRELRGNGIGRRLFDQICGIAKSQGNEKLYLSTHPSVETQAFFHAMGCILAEEINADILAREPRDLQLEKKL